MSVNAEEALNDSTNGAIADAALNEGEDSTSEVDNQPVAIDYEAEAREMGWNPDYKGPNQKTAQQFYEDGQTILPIVQANSKKYKERADRLEVELREHKTNSEKSIQALQKHFERETERKIAEIKAGKEKAVANADLDAFKKLEAEEAELLKKPEPEKPKDNDFRSSPSIKAWESENPWYGTDKDLTAYANGISSELRGETDKTGKDFLDLVAEHVKKTFPHKFKNPRKENFSAAPPSSRSQSAKSTSFDTLPASAKSNFKYAVNRGLIKDSAESRQQFAKDWTEAE